MPPIPLTKTTPKIQVAEILTEIAKLPNGEAYERLKSGESGLAPEEAALRLGTHGPNDITQAREDGWVARLLTSVRNPLVILLSTLALVSGLTGDLRAATVIAVMVVIGITLRFVQEARAGVAAAKLRAMIRVTATVIRGGNSHEIPLRELVPGDVVRMTAGDMVPADVRLLTSKDLFINQASLTGESLPAEKIASPQIEARHSALEYGNLCFLGTSVESGTASAIVVVTGKQTYFGSMAGTLTTAPAETSFEHGVNRFTWLMIRFMMVMVPIVFLMNGLTKHDWREAFFFSLAVAVGLTPEMLPMIVSVCLSKGAIGMSRKKVIVKRLHSIQNLGAMDVLCSDKTGTLTQDRVILEQHSGVDFQEYDDVVNSAYLISHFQTGLKNLLDQAILQHFELHDHLRVAEAKKVDEIPFDFSRRMMSVVIEKADGVYQLLSKGAPEEILKRSTRYDLNGKILPMTAEFLAGQKEGYERLNSEGFRVLAVAYRDLATHSSASKLDESELILQGYLAFLDPPKETAGPALAALQTHGIQIKVLTGDSHLVTLKVCKDVGLKVDRVVRGDEVEAMTEVQLGECVEHNNIFARLSPAHKRRIIEALKARGHVVGFLGDGINDSPALRASDVGISVDSAVDIAKESADIILLEKNLLVLVDGVMEGRKVFVNILKYVRMGASSNFGNMFSVLGASIALPFVPMAPIQILTNNLLYDFSQIAIPTDSVDDELILKPRPWVIDEITRFMLFVGPISSIFDYSTFALMYYVFDCRDASQAPLFQTGWFIESLMTQTLIIHIIRTNRIPFLRSRPSTLLVLTTISILLIGAALPYSPLAGALGFVPLPQAYWPYLLGTLLCYALLTLGVKRWMLSRRWIS